MTGVTYEWSKFMIFDWAVGDRLEQEVGEDNLIFEGLVFFPELKMNYLN